MIQDKSQDIPNQEIVVFDKSHVDKIVDFQLKMALQLEHLQLNRQIVKNAVQFLDDHHQFGFYLIKLTQQIPTGLLLVAAQTTQSLWFASVYVDSNYRSRGHFKSLFQEICKIAKSKGLKSVKNYVGIEQAKLKRMYQKLGMHLTGEKFYVFTIKKENIVESNQIQIKNGQLSQINLSNYKDLLENQNPSKTKHVLIFKQKTIIGVVFYFTEFTEWEFGLIYYVESFYIAQNTTMQDLNNVHNALCSFFYSQQEIGAYSIRYLFNSRNDQILQLIKGGEIEHYEVMQIDL